MKTIIKIYRNNLVCDILSASCLSELRNNIDAIVSKLRSEHLTESQLTILLNDTLRELKLLNEGRLPYDQHANIISAKNILKELRVQESKPGDGV